MKSNFNPLVSIVIPVYNGSNYVSEAIDSALAQTYKNIEIIVVNDGSTDGTEEIVKSYGKKLRYFKKENGGVSTALNLGIKKSKGEYISWLSHDDLYYSNKIERQVEELKNFSVKTRVNSIIFARFDILNMSSGTTINSPNEILYPNQSDPYYTFSMIDCFLSSKINGCTLFFPRNVFNKIGFFDDDKKTVQDYLLFIKFLKAGVRYVFINESLIISRHHENQDTLKKIDLHLTELNYLYRFIFDLYKDYFVSMPIWQFDYFLNIIKNRGLDKVYAYMLSGWSNKGVEEGKPIIWMYWENKKGNRTPDYVRLCWKSIIINNKDDFIIRIITEDDVDYYLPDINHNYKNFVEVAHKADYIRFKLLYKYGGIWLDSDFVSFRSLFPVIEKIKKNGFVCMGYFRKNNYFFPLIGFLASVPRNEICKKVINDIEMILENNYDNKIKPKWDEIGGSNLAKYIQKDNCYKYNSYYFCPYEIQFNSGNEMMFYTSKKVFVSKIINPTDFVFGQNIANSILSDSVRNISEHEILESSSLLGDLLRFGNSSGFFHMGRRKIFNLNLKYKINLINFFKNLKLEIKKVVVILFYRLDKIFPSKIRKKIKKKLVKNKFIRKYLVGR